MASRFVAWKEGPGRVFRRPLPGSTNYLNAYNKQGELIRRTFQNRQDEELGQQRKEQRKKQSRSRYETEEDREAEAEEVLPDEEKARREETVRRLEAAATPSYGKEADKKKLPPEQPADLRPFPLNPNFTSERVLSEELREIIFVRVKEQERPIREVSAEFKVSMERVAAVVRMKQMERDWLAKNKTPTTIYSRNVLAMLPKTPYNGPTVDPEPHESINDLPVHPATMSQIFYPTSESRAFTREDAGHAFKIGLLPADKRIPHPELVELEQMKNAKATKEEIKTTMLKRAQEELEMMERKNQKKKERDARDVKVYHGRKWDFKFSDFSLDETIGRNERSRKGVGARYGFPHEDRKRGQVKIPTSVA